MAIERKNSDSQPSEGRNRITEVPAAGADYQSIINQANSTDDPDAFKYAAAVDLARQALGTESLYDDRLFRETIDAEYENLSPSTSAADLRGENFITQGVRAAKEGIDDFNVAVGNGLDWIWDNTAGAIAPQTKDWFDGEDASVISDIGSDILLSLVPGAGIPLVLGKNAIQQSGNLYEGATGYDATTGEKLEDGQSAAKLGSAALTTGLSAIPGIGKAGNALRATSKAGKAGKAADTASKTAKSTPAGASAKAATSEAKQLQQVADALDMTSGVKGFGNAIKNIPNEAINYGKNVGSGIAEAGRLVRPNVTRGANSAAREAAGASGVHPIQAFRALNRGLGNNPAIGPSGPKTLSGLRANQRGNELFGEQLAKRANQGRIKEGARELAKAAGGKAAGLGAVGANSVLANSAATGDSLGDSALNVISQLGENPGQWLPYAFPVGAKKLSRNASGIRGASQAQMPSAQPLNAAMAAAAGNQQTRLGESDNGAGNEEEEIIRRLQALQR